MYDAKRNANFDYHIVQYSLKSFEFKIKREQVALQAACSLLALGMH